MFRVQNHLIKPFQNEAAVFKPQNWNQPLKLHLLVTNLFWSSLNFFLQPCYFEQEEKILILLPHCDLNDLKPCHMTIKP